MITYIDIKKAINSNLIKKFSIEVNSKDISEGFVRPSFFVEFLNPIRWSSADQIHKSFSVQIYYFPTDRYDYSLEILDVQEQLENLFDLKLKVHDRYFNIDEAKSNVTDGILNFSFDLEFYDGREFEGLENIIIEQEVIGDDQYKEETGNDFYEDHPVEKMGFLEIDKE